MSGPPPPPHVLLASWQGQPVPQVAPMNQQSNMAQPNWNPASGFPMGPGAGHPMQQYQNYTVYNSQPGQPQAGPSTQSI